MDYEFEEDLNDNTENHLIENNNKIRDNIINALFEEKTFAHKNNNDSPKTKNLAKIQIDILRILSEYGYKSTDKNVQLVISSFLDNLSRI